MKAQNEMNKKNMANMRMTEWMKKRKWIKNKSDKTKKEGKMRMCLKSERQEEEIKSWMTKKSQMRKGKRKRSGILTRERNSK